MYLLVLGFLIGEASDSCWTSFLAYGILKFPFDVSLQLLDFSFSSH